MQGELLRRARERAGLSITEVARRAGMSRVTLYDVEGGNEVQLSTLRRLAQIYDVPVRSLIAEDDAVAV